MSDNLAVKELNEAVGNRLVAYRAGGSELEDEIAKVVLYFAGGKAFEILPYDGYCGCALEVRVLEKT